MHHRFIVKVQDNIYLTLADDGLGIGGFHKHEHLTRYESYSRKSSQHPLYFPAQFQSLPTGCHQCG